MNPASPEPSFQLIRWERILCLLTILAKCFAFWKQKSLMIGFDIGDHLFRLSDFQWWTPDPALRAMYYAYHPPLGFILPNLLGFWTDDAVLRVQFFNTLSAIGALLFLRAALHRLGLLHTWSGIAFLYLWAGLPMVVHTGFSLNLDLPLLAGGAALLFFSIGFAKETCSTFSLPRITYACAIAFSISTLLLIKFNGLIACSLPLLVHLAIHGWRRLPVGLFKTSLPVILGIALVLPYYWQRYYQPEKVFFPRNNLLFYPEESAAARAERDENPIKFWQTFVTPSILQPARPVDLRDRSHIRLSDVWRDFFIRERDLYFPEPPPSPQLTALTMVGRFYRALFAIAVIAGLLLWLRNVRNQKADTLNAIFCPLAIFHLLALMLYCYLEGSTRWYPNKGIYILPVSWTIASLSAASLVWLTSHPSLRFIGGNLLPPLLIVWLLTNHCWPVY